MGYILTNKIEVIGGEISGTSIAFPDTSDNLAVFATWSEWEAWVESNKAEDESLPDTSGTICYGGNLQVESIEGMELTLIETL